MLSYIIRRLASGVLLVVAVSIAVFLLLHLMPGDPIDSLVPKSVPEEKKEQYREEWGLNLPLPMQYLNWAKRVLHGDLGKSLDSGLPINKSLSGRIPYSVKLCGISLVLELVISVPIGLIAAYKRGSHFDRFIMGYSMITEAIPSFWIGMVLILIFGVGLNWLPVSGFTKPKHYIMPITAMVLGNVSSTIRLTRSEVLGVINEKYVTTAYAKGLPKKVVMYKHVLRNALILIVVSTFLSLPWIISGAVIMENVFGIPGMGAWLASSVIIQDFPVVQACILIISILTVIANLLADICTALLDPRVRDSMSGGAQ